MKQNRALRILVISDPPWAEENNTGNTLSNLFRNVHAEFANLYFRAGIPHNDLCRYYYQVTDYQIMQRWLKGKAVGRSFTMEALKENKAFEKDTSFDVKARRHRGFYTTLLRELAWKVTKTDTDSMYRFIDAFHPDLIYAPIYGNLHMLRIMFAIQSHTHLPMVSLISDDHYFRQLKKTAFLERGYQHALKRSLRRLLKHISCLYTMSEEQAKAYGGLYGKPLKIMRKNAFVPYVRHPKHVPLKILYAGGLYLGREKTLIEVAQAVKRLNHGEHHFELHIYTNAAEHKVNTLLNDHVNSFLHEGIPYRQLIEKYRDCDIALHAEGFDEVDAEVAKMSFSTKILDCLQSGAPVLCIAPKKNAGAEYLRREQAALICSLKDIESSLQELDTHYEKWQKAAYQCLKKNHDAQKNTAAFAKELQRLAGICNDCKHPDQNENSIDFLSKQSHIKDDGDRT